MVTTGNEALDAIFSELFPANRLHWFKDRPTWFQGKVEEIKQDKMVIVDIDGFADWAGELYAVVGKAVLPYLPPVEVGSMIRFNAVIRERPEGIVGDLAFPTGSPADDAVDH